MELRAIFISEASASVCTVGEEMDTWIIASLCLFRWHQHPYSFRLPEHQLHQHPNAMATASCDTGRCCGFPPSLASKDGRPGTTRTPLWLNNICHILPIQPPIHLNWEEAVGQNQWGVLAITDRGRVHRWRKTPVHIAQIISIFPKISKLDLFFKSNKFQCIFMYLQQVDAQ